jgi:C4-dicarboxylate transporter DctM subunit
MLVYGFVAGASVRDLFVSGVVPGVLFGVAMMAICIDHGRRYGWDRGGERASAAEIFAAFRAALPALTMPLLILGGIWTGLFTPTESAAVAVAYGLLISIGVYRDLRWRDLPALMLNAFVTSAVVMVVIGATSALAWLITVEQVPAQLTAMVKEIASAKWSFLLLVNAVLLVLGIFLEPLPALILTAPVLVPMARAFGIDLVHLGLLMTCNLAIGLYSPPVGGTLFVAGRIAGVGIGAISRALVPLFLSSLVVLALITYVEWLPMGLVWLARG